MDSGILLLNKQAGITSNSIINNVKRLLNSKGINIKKIGHAGTLDPNATGLLVVLINDATKISDFLLLEDKEYIAEIELGSSYDTFDIWGNVIDNINLDEKKLADINLNIDKVLESFLGDIYQTPPMYSSIKVNGKKLYEMARKGVNLDLKDKARKVKIYSIERLNELYLTENKKIRFTIKCKVSKGTYIRSLAKDIGDMLSIPSCMSSLKRIKSGGFSLDNAYTIEDIELGKYQLVNMLDCIPNIKHINANEELYKDCINGKKIKYKEDDNMLAIAYNNELVAIYEKEGNMYKAKRVWN